VYRRWYQRYHDRNVVLIGIQSPETALERDLEAVRHAAVDRKPGMEKVSGLFSGAA
jgi:hypothetical protein